MSESSGLENKERIDTPPLILPPDERNKDIASILKGIATKHPYAEVQAFASTATSLSEIQQPSDTTISGAGERQGANSVLNLDTIFNETDEIYQVQYLGGAYFHPGALFYPELSMEENRAIITALKRQSEDEKKIARAIIEKDHLHAESAKKIQAIINHNKRDNEMSKINVAERDAAERMRIKYHKPLQTLLSQYPNLRGEYLREVARGELTDTSLPKKKQPLTVAEVVAMTESIITDERQFITKKYGLEQINVEEYLSVESVYPLIRDRDTYSSNSELLYKDAMTLTLHIWLIQKLERELEENLTRTVQKNPQQVFEGRIADRFSELETYLYSAESFLLFSHALYESLDPDSTYVIEPRVFADYAKRQFALYAIANNLPLPDYHISTKGNLLDDRDAHSRVKRSHLSHEFNKPESSHVTSMNEAIKALVAVPFVIDYQEYKNPSVISEISTYAEETEFHAYDIPRHLPGTEVFIKTKKNAAVGNDQLTDNVVRIFAPEFATLTSIDLKSGERKLIPHIHYKVEYTPASGHYRIRLTDEGMQKLNYSQSVSYTVGIDPSSKNIDVPIDLKETFHIENIDALETITSQLEKSGYTAISQKLSGEIAKSRASQNPIPFTIIEQIIRENSLYIFSLPEGSTDKTEMAYLPPPTPDGKMQGQCGHFAELLKDIFTKTSQYTVATPISYQITPLKDLGIGIPGLPHTNAKVRNRAYRATFDATPSSNIQEARKLQQTQTALVNSIKNTGVEAFIESSKETRETKDVLVLLGERGVLQTAKHLESTFVDKILLLTNSSRKTAFPQGIVAIGELLRRITTQADELSKNTFLKHEFMSKVEILTEEWEQTELINHTHNKSSHIQQEGFVKYAGDFAKHSDIPLTTLVQVKEYLKAL